VKCLICNAEMKYFFSKEYTKEPWASFMKDIRGGGRLLQVP
jgi:hypothetical protein